MDEKENCRTLTFRAFLLILIRQADLSFVLVPVANALYPKFYGVGLE